MLIIMTFNWHLHHTVHVIVAHHTESLNNIKTDSTNKIEYKIDYKIHFFLFWRFTIQGSYIEAFYTSQVFGTCMYRVNANSVL